MRYVCPPAATRSSATPLASRTCSFATHLAYYGGDASHNRLNSLLFWQRLSIHRSGKTKVRYTRRAANSTPGRRGG